MTETTPPDEFGSGRLHVQMFRLDITSTFPEAMLRGGFVAPEDYIDFGALFFREEEDSIGCSISGWYSSGVLAGPVPHGVSNAVKNGFRLFLGLKI